MLNCWSLIKVCFSSILDRIIQLRSKPAGSRSLVQSLRLGEKVCTGCGLVLAREKPKQEAPLDRGITNFLLFNKGLGTNPSQGVLARIINISGKRLVSLDYPERLKGKRHEFYWRCQALNQRVSQSIIPNQRLRKALSCASKILIQLGACEDHVLSNEVGRIIRLKMREWNRKHLDTNKIVKEAIRLGYEKTS